MNGSKTLRLDYIIRILYHLQVLLFVIGDKVLQKKKNTHGNVFFSPWYFQASITKELLWIKKKKEIQSCRISVILEKAFVCSESRP